MTSSTRSPKTAPLCCASTPAYAAEAISRRRALRLIGATTLGVSALAAFGCSTDTPDPTDPSSVKIVMGTLATEDFLPMWVAEDRGLFTDAGLNVEIQVFQSATELQAGIKSGQVDYAMTDPMVSAAIFVSGTNVRIEWITLGATTQQGRFGIMANAENAAAITSLADMKGKQIAVGSNTILEYVMDTLLGDAGLAQSDYEKVEVQKLPVRYQNMLDGVVECAALPASLLALGEANGCVVVADDSTGERNISQSVMISRRNFIEKEGGAATLDALKEVWNHAVELINADPELFRNLLVSKTNLNDAIAQTYPVSEYPTCQLPTSEMIDPVLTWMSDKGYLEYAITYNPETGAFVPNI